MYRNKSYRANYQLPQSQPTLRNDTLETAKRVEEEHSKSVNRLPFLRKNTVKIAKPIEYEIPFFTFRHKFMTLAKMNNAAGDLNNYDHCHLFKSIRYHFRNSR